MDLTEPGVVGPLMAHLSVADGARLLRATCTRPAQQPDVVGTLARRCGIKRKVHTLRALGTLMATGHRCIECGIKTERKPSVCAPCAADQGTRVAMMTRKQIWAKYRELRPGKLRGIVRSMRCVKRDSCGRFFYWSADVRAALGSGTSVFAHGPKRP